MKLATLALPFALLLLVAPLAAAEAASTPSTPKKVELADIFAAPEESATAQPDCSETEPALFEPAPSEMQTGACGACSDTICQGMKFGQVCKFESGRWYYCQPAYMVCVINDCQCWTGPLP